MKKIGFLFPSQSTQYVGMGKDLYDNIPVCREVFDRANEVTGVDIKGICFDGPLETLNETVNTQPCILTVSVATFRALQEYGIRPAAVAGFSLGEFSAMVAGGILRFEDALRVLHVRANAMQTAVPLGAGTMIGVKSEKAARAIEICQEISEGYTALANANSPTNLLFSGETPAMKVFSERLTEEGIKNRVIAVSVPSHCDLMNPAREPLREVLATTEMHSPAVDFYMCADAEKETDVEKIREKEVRQMCTTVQCEGIIRNMLRDGVNVFVELGPKNAYSQYVIEIAPEDTQVLHVEDVATLNRVVAALQED